MTKPATTPACRRAAGALAAPAAPAAPAGRRRTAVQGGGGRCDAERQTFRERQTETETETEAEADTERERV